MIRIIRGQLVFINIKIKEDIFSMDVTIFYRYFFYKIKKIHLTRDIDDENTATTNLGIIDAVIEKLDKMFKI